MNESIEVRRSEDRGHADHGWLKSYHSFSFARYYDPANMGFRSLRVINQDVVAPGGGFPSHPHDNMEIFSYVLEGEMAHSDSMGNTRVLNPGEIQLMSAGTGITHSEFNPSNSQNLHLLQIWIHPSIQNLEPSYTEWKPQKSTTKIEKNKTLIISPTGEENSAIIHQDARIYRLILQPDQSIDHHLEPGRGIYVQLIHGPLSINGITLNPGDAAHSDSTGTYQLKAGQQKVEALLFDLV